MGKQLPSLKQLIEGCKNKEVRSEELLYKTFYGYISGVAFRYIKERSIIMELVNDAFIRIFKKIEGFNFDGPPEELPKVFKGWIGRITANAAIDRIRSKKTLLYIDEITDEGMMQIAIEPHDTLSFNDIMQLLDQLPPIQQLIFNMHAIEGFSHEEIAVQLKIPPSTSRVYLTRARTKLIECYQKTMNTPYETRRQVI